MVREQIWIQHVENANFWSNWGNHWHLKAFYCDFRLMKRACGFETQHLSEHTLQAWFKAATFDTKMKKSIIGYY